MKSGNRRSGPTDLSRRARDLAREDQGAPGWIDRVDALLVELGFDGAAVDVLACAAWLDEPVRALAERATGAIVAVLGRSGPLELARLDAAIRSPWWGGVGSLRTDWLSISSELSGHWNPGGPPARLNYWMNPPALGLWATYDPGGHAFMGLPSLARRRFESAGPFAAGLLGLASMHHVGFVREVVVGKLARVDDGSELPYLLIRANDWVEPVRAAAARALADRVRPEYVPHFLRNLPLVNRLAAGERGDHGPFVAAVRALLQAPEARDALLGGLRSAEPLVARSCFGLAVESPALPLGEVLAAVADHPDHSIRLAATRAGRARLATADFVVRAPTWLADRFAPVRREALLGLVERAPERAEGALRAALLDPARSAREVARFYLPRLIPFDVATFYREALGSTPAAKRPWALAGLGETGHSADADLVRPVLEDANPRVRREAVRAVGRLDGPAHVPALLAALTDAQPRVSRAAAEALARHARLVPAAALVGLVADDPRPHVRRRALGLLARVGKWPALAHLIRTTHDPDSALASRANTLLAAWIANFNRSPVRPSAPDIADALAALANATLPAETDRTLRFLLKGW